MKTDAIEEHVECKKNQHPPTTQVRCPIIHIDDYDLAIISRSLISPFYLRETERRRPDDDFALS